MKRRPLVLWLASFFSFPLTLKGEKSKRRKPAPGDSLVFAFGGNKGMEIGLKDVGADIVFAFAKGADGSVKDGSLHNQISLVRVEKSAMSDKTKEYASSGVLAVSSACTHTGCEVSGWRKDTSELVCPCHGSRFAILDSAKVVNGPAIKPLAFLPIESEGDLIRVKGKFSRRVGPAPTY